MYGNILVIAFLIGAPLLGVLHVAAIEVYTSKELESVNGTDVRLKCTFTTSAPVGNSVTVSWNFRPQAGGSEESVFYYHSEPFPPTDGRFKGRAIWSGDISRKDASITIRDVQHTDNGTFTCQVKNPPDAHGLAGEVKLSVVQRVRYSELYILAMVIGGAIGLIIFLVLLFVSIRFCWRRKKQQNWDGQEHHECEERKELTMEKKSPEATA